MCISQLPHPATNCQIFLHGCINHITFDERYDLRSSATSCFHHPKFRKDNLAQSLQPKELQRLKRDDELSWEAQRLVKSQLRPTDPTLEGRVINGLKLSVFLSGRDILGPHKDAMKITIFWAATSLTLAPL